MCMFVHCWASHTHTHPSHTHMHFRCGLHCHSSAVSKASCSLHFSLDKLTHCFLGTIIKKKKQLNYLVLNIPQNLILLCAAVGTQALIPSVILSLCFEGDVTQRQASLSVWTERTSSADVTVAADIHSSGPGPALRAAVLIEDQMLKAEAVSWLEMSLLCFSMNHWTKREKENFICLWYSMLDLSGNTSIFNC